MRPAPWRALLLPLLLLLLLQPAAATKWFLFGRPHIFAVEPQQQYSKSKRGAETKWEQQPLDHFDPILQAEGHFWKQRYFEALCPQEQQQQQQQQEQQQQKREVEETGPKPIFVYIGGEAELKPQDATTGHFASLLETFKADGYALEHRFYGRSLPQPTAEADNLRWLTAEQALADLAFFIENRRRERAAAQGTSPQAIPVVVFGCSYPGALAAFARVKYPALISGSISSSSPVLAKEKFVSFDRKVQQGLPDSCRAAAAAAVAALNRNVTLGHMEEELRRFDCPDIPSQTDADKVAFVYSVVDTLSEAVQYERPVVRPLVELLCNFLGSPPASSKEATKKVEEVAPAPAETASRGSEAAGSAAMKGNLEAGIGSQPQLDETHSSGEGAAETAAEDREEALLNGLASYFQAALKRKSASCKEVNILAAKNTALDGSVLSSTRLWMWQSCAQFGFWQVGFPGSLRPQSIDVNFHLDVCNKLFPLRNGGRFADQGIRETNLWSGGRHLADMHAATNIHFTNGEKDPWSTLSVLDVQSQVQDSQHISAFVIEGRCVFLQGGSHCTDFYGPTAQDSKSLQLGRAAIAAAVEGFIARHRESLSDAHAVETPQHQDDGSRGGALLRPQEGETKKPSTSEL